MKQTDYDRRYLENESYWGNKISQMAQSILELAPIQKRPLEVLEIGCGEGANAVFLARNGYSVTAFDLSKTAIEKTNIAAAHAQVKISTFVEDINSFVPKKKFDIVFSSGTLQYLLPEKRVALIDAVKQLTNPGGINVLHTFAKKAYIATAPDAEDCEFLWSSGELLSLFQGWRIERFVEEIKSCNSSGVAHEHCHNRIWARKI